MVTCFDSFSKQIYNIWVREKFCFYDTDIILNKTKELRQVFGINWSRIKVL